MPRTCDKKSTGAAHRRAPAHFAGALALVFGLLAAAPRAGAEEPVALPAGAVLYFAGDECPSGWTSPASLSGFMIAMSPVDRANPNAVTTGPAVPGIRALDPFEDRQHSHAAISGEITPKKVGFGAVPGAGKHLADTGTKAWTATGDGSRPASSNLPYIQYLACQKNDGRDAAPAGVDLGGSEAPGAPEGAAIPGTADTAVDADPLPEGLLYFTTESTCLEGFNRPEGLAGDLLLAAPSGAAVGQSFGGSSITPGSYPTHRHTVAQRTDFPSKGVSAPKGDRKDWSGHAAVDYSGASTSDGVNLPIYLLNFCLKPSTEATQPLPDCAGRRTSGQDDSLGGR
ncbi:MAG: hypothetical protein AAGF23_19645, partial [Acidobacteriota bacterium]